VSLALLGPALAALVWGGGSPVGAAGMVAVLAVAAAVAVGASAAVEPAPVRVAGAVAWRAAVPVLVRQCDPDTAGRPRPRAPGRGGSRAA
jgi:hypothetical protein